MSEPEIKASSVSTSLSSDANVVKAAADSAAQDAVALAARDTAQLPADSSLKPVTTAPTQKQGADDSVETTDDISKRVAADSTDIGPLPTMDDFAAIKDGVTPEFKGAQKKDEKKDEKKEALPKEDKKAQDVQQTTTQTETQRVARDYSGLTDEEVGLCKRMSNDAFSYVKPALLERKKLGDVIKSKDQEIANLKVGKQIMPDNYYEHPEAFVLSPEYNEAQQNLSMLNTAQTHYQAQLARIEKGEPWQALSLNEKTGQLQYGPAQEPSIEAKFEVMKVFQNLNTEVQNRSRQLGELKNSFKERHTQASSIITQAVKDHLGMYDDPKHPMAPMLEHFRSQIPAEFKKSPMAEWGVRTTVGMLQFKKAYESMLQENAELKKQLAAGGATRISTAKAAAGPNEGDVENSGTTNGKAAPVDVTIDDFEAIKRS